MTDYQYRAVVYDKETFAEPTVMTYASYDTLDEAVASGLRQAEDTPADIVWIERKPISRWEPV